jgi:hypothetical protein
MSCLIPKQFMMQGIVSKKAYNLDKIIWDEKAI